MEQNTHLGIDRELVGIVRRIGPGTSEVSLLTTAEMCADERGLVHGGFTFGLADYAAMVAVNDPNVVLGAAEVKFLAPVAVNEELVAVASTRETKGRKHVVEVVVRMAETAVLEGTFTTFVLDGHVLDGR